MSDNQQDVVSIPRHVLEAARDALLLTVAIDPDLVDEATLDAICTILESRDES